MAEDSQDISDYRDAIEGMLLNGEALEALFAASSNTAPDSLDAPKAIGITSVRLVVCYRHLKREDFDRWSFTSIPFSRIDEVQLARRERFHRDRIESSTSVAIYGGRLADGSSGSLSFDYGDALVAREVHDRILAHILAV
jgi:hypothetical protein